MNKRRGIVWKNFLILMSFITGLTLCITYFIYRNTVSVMNEEFSNVNMDHAVAAENNLVLTMEQTNRLASGICVLQKSLTFWGVEQPELLKEDFYSELSSILKSYAYGVNNTVYSIMLYSDEYKRVMDASMDEPYMLSGTQEDAQKNTDWIQGLTDLKGDKVRTTIATRQINGKYPHVLSFIKQYYYGDGWGAVAVDVNLEELYSAIWPQNVSSTSVYILDAEGRVIVNNEKNSLYASTAEFPQLELFSRTEQEVSLVLEDGKNPYAYAQRYNETYGLYIVAVSELDDFNQQMQIAQLETIGIGASCIIIACLLVWVYSYMASRPVKSILNFLQNSADYQDFPVTSEREVQEIVDYIVASLQKNEELENQLEKRMDILRKTQLQALIAQINPHFLFNTLNVIVMLIDAEVEDSVAAQVTADLADILKYALSNEDLVLLSEEVESAKKYVYILEQRYKNRFKTIFNVSPELHSVRIPKLILQPLIENAVFHGIAAKSQNAGGTLTIEGKKEKLQFGDEEIWGVRIDIIDNGRGMSRAEIDKVLHSLKKEPISMEHIGIENVAKRLSLLFPGKSSLEIQSTPGEGTCVSLMFPYAE